MIYCMSDIHGELDRFKAMLDLINFSSDDTLYIIGDVIDRHPGGVEILKIIKDTPNMFMLLGNHEQMCLDTLGPNSVYGSRRLWLENGGSNTYRELLYVCSLAERSRIIHFLSTLPDHFDVEVGDRKFHLVHAMPSDDPDDRIWTRAFLLSAYQNGRNARTLQQKQGISNDCRSIYARKSPGIQPQQAAIRR